MKCDEELNQTVGELGEAGVLRRILAQLVPAEAATLGPGDDCAVLRVAGPLVVTSDTMIEGPDFRSAWHSGYELGWKLAATNLSDVAAMGARPIGLTVALAVPRDTPVELLEDIMRGLNTACAELAPGCGVVGGDLGTASVITAAVTALGDMDGRPPVTRAGAQPGDQLAYAGDLGLAGLGLSLLFSDGVDADGVAHARGLEQHRRDHGALISAQLAPSPPIRLGVQASEAGATSMMDVSDSLSLDSDRLARASSAGSGQELAIDLDPELLIAAFGEQGGEFVPVEAMLAGVRITVCSRRSLLTPSCPRGSTRSEYSGNRRKRQDTSW
ncbi:thiamine-phosphate kinase [Leucobacter insecticola]|uniref:thiamine-phosphate kinase n=1 Tax=Leucobacter insecticola TaxID=2714934 RepID=UPI001FCB6FD0|nr:thiamine-phosphate kinase [Leucobacter insecticola]